MTLADSDLHALAALAEAASKPGYSNADYDAFVEAADCITVGELITRVLRAEAIAADLAKRDPTYAGHKYGEPTSPECTLCGEDSRGADEMQVTDHAESCAWRRAVEAQP